MSFRVNLPIENAQQLNRAAADGQMGTIMKMYRDWQLSGDDELLKTLWPNVKKAIEFCWIEGGWDADKDGILTYGELTKAANKLLIQDKKVKDAKKDNIALNREIADLEANINYYSN